MFESLVANLLNRFLGSYVENFDSKQLNIGIWSGDVKLRNLKLKKESLDKFKLPVDVKCGYIGELTLQIPWSNLKSKPAKVIIEDVYVLASPIILQNYDLNEENAREQQLKRERLKDLETIEQAAAQNESLADDMNKNESFTESLITKIIDNLQVTIKDIHVRYEDDSVYTETPYAIGLTLNELSAVSTDESWLPSFISITQVFLRKLLTLKNLSCYMNTESSSIYTEDQAKLLAIFKEFIVTENNLQDLQFLLKPVSGTGKLTIHKTGSTETVPHIKAELFFKEFGVELDSQQYRDILWTASKFHWYMKTQKFRKFRPTVPAQQDPKGWFRYAANSILNEIHEKNYKWSWEYFAKRRDQRKAYIALWKLKIRKKPLSTSQQAELENLEEELPFEDIKFYRSLTKNEIRKETSLSAATSASTQNSGNIQSNKASDGGGWLSYSYWWGNGNNKDQNHDAENDNLDLKLSDEQRKALYDAIDYDDKQELVDSISLPRDRVKFEVLASLERGGLSIRPKKHEDNLAEIIFEGCNATYYQRPDSFLANFQLQEFRVEDGTKKTIYKHIVSVKHLHSNFHEEEEPKDHDDPFFQVSYEQNPLDNSANSALLAKLRSMTIFYNPVFIEEVVKFFTPPKAHLDTVGAIMNAAEATVEGITEQTRIGLQYALEEHKTINAKLDLQAPLIILPLDPTSFESSVAILDAGHISVTSSLVEQSKIDQIKSKQSYSADDWKELNTLMYDQFSLRLQDAQFFVGPKIKTTMEQLHDENGDKPSLVLNKLNIKLMLGISILPDAYHLAKFKVGGEVPEISLALNDFQYKTIMLIIDVAIPKFEDIESDDSSIFNAFGNQHGASIDSIDSDSDERSLFENKSSKQNDLSNQQHIFEFNFIVTLVRMSLSRCVDGVTLEAEPLVDLIGDSLDLNFYNTATQMNLEMTVKDINLLDHIEKSGVPEFEKLISSNNFIDDEERKEKDLFKLNYKRSQRVVDFNSNEIEIFDQDITIDLATVKFVISRKSLLSILNFILNTFTDPNAEPTPADELKHNDSTNDEEAPQKINVDIKLDSIIMVLNDDGIKLATLELSTANIKTFIVPELLEVWGKLGALSLHDETNQGTPDNSLLKNLIAMEGDNLAEFRYKTFDKETNSDPYTALVEFKTGSLIINFVEDSLNKILNYLNQFQRMKAIYDSAREAAINQASQIEGANNIKFDVSIHAPTIVFPKLNTDADNKYDEITVSLGELYASNEFKVDSSHHKNIITTGIRKVSVLSEFYFKDAIQSSEILHDLDVSFKIDYAEEYVKNEPTIKVVGKMPEISLSLTELQVNYLKSLSESITRVFTFDPEEVMTDIEADAINANAVVRHNVSGVQSSETISNSPQQETKDDKIPDDHTKVDLSFELPMLSVSLFNKTFGLADFNSQSLSEMNLGGLKASFCMEECGNFTSDVTVNSLTVRDIRKGTSNKFREIIPLTNNGKDQFVVSSSSSGSAKAKSITISAAVDSPRTILAIDWLIELQGFFDKSFASNASPKSHPNEDARNLDMVSSRRSSVEANTKPNDTTAPNIGFSVDIKEPSVTILADPCDEKTEAIVFKVEQIQLTSQNILSLAASNIGMFLCTMNDFDNMNYRIIDDFSISLAHDSRNSTPTKLLTNVQASVDPLLLRVSLRDIRLALMIFNKATDYYKVSQGLSKEDDDNEYNFTEEFKKRLAHYAPSILTTFTEEPSKSRHDLTSSLSETEVVVKGEEFNASIGGLRFVLIGDVHELPVLDMRVNPFDIRAVNWSTDLSAELHVESFVNIYNYSCSTWEPLVEPWPISVYASKTLPPTQSVVIDVVSRQSAEITISSRSIALMSQVFSLITTEQKLKPRGEDSPYKVVNETGYEIEIWTDQGSGSKSRVIKPNEVAPWAFESWTEVRKNLDTDNEDGIFGIRLKDSPFEDVGGISAMGEGEEIFMLSPPIKGVHSRLSCEITLGDDKVKTIWLKSTVKIQNDANYAIAVSLEHDDQTNSVEMVIDADKTRALPIDAVYSGSIRIKPHIETAYAWSDEKLFLRNLPEDAPLRCASLDPGDKTSYFYHAETVYDKNEPLARIYPHLKLIISAPLQVENLLPFDISYRLYDKSSKKDWSGTIEKGINSYIHVVSLKSLLLLSVTPKGCNFGKSDFAIINAPSSSEFKRENILTLRNKDGQLLKLRIHYPKNTQESAGIKVIVYSPYVILNRTGQNITASERGNQMISIGKSSFNPVTPSLFSFDRHGDRRNRALLKINDSTWTPPLSFDAIGQSIETKAQVSGKQAEINVGITVLEGEGKYNLTKVVTIAPRYVIRNTLDEAIQIVENGSTRQTELEPNKLVPLYGLLRTEKKSMMLKFSHSSKTWSSPFALDDIGQLFIKVYKEDIGQVLLKVNILIENATIFIQVENANNSWPFSIRNFSESEFYIYQNNPNVNANGEVVKSDIDYKPIYYKIPPKSVMPYAYDYPNAVVKELVIRSHGRERSVNLAEIGNLKPFRLPPTDNADQEIVDLNVVADGPTQSLIITNYDPSVSLYKLQSKSNSTATVSQQFEATEEDENYHTRLLTKFEGFGISLINARNQELCYVTLRGLEVRYNESDLYQNLSIKLKWIQIDNQLYGGIFPIVLYPTVVPKSGKEMNNHPSFSGSVSRVKDDSHGVLFIKYATILLQEMTIEIDEDFLFALIEFSKIPGASWNNEQVDVLCDYHLELPEPKSLSERSDIYFEALHLQPTLTNLSFVRTERVNAENRVASSQNTLMFFFNVLTMAIGNINDAPIKLNALFIENIRVPIPILIESIKTHYGQSFFYQVHKILGSADFLGNPVGLFNQISSGVLDIFYEPYQGFVMNDRPQELGIGIAKGGLSFLKKSIFGFSDSFAKVTGSLAKGLSVATLDTKFQERRRLNQHRNKPKHALYGFASGANSFFESISSGVTGIATAPIEGANKGGASGFFRGIGKGVVGLPTKTAIGFFDLASNVSEGIRNTTTVFDAEGLDKVRLPRYISYDHVIRPYSQRESQGQFWLMSIDGGVYFNETYLAHLVLPGEEKAIIVTFKKILLFDINTLVSVWVISYDQIKAISIDSTGITVGLKKREGPFIPIPEKQSRTFLYGRIKIAVEEFNKHCQVVI
ncbi:uncharacterized protein PRCAT00002364001 [Priceomyces carsonii]|uniref:uncharacterized protein n=1 Tax=Priceomyces carsonii TaxID=28549 RepID=UPI002EDAFAD4|nr:unnamed protein product [Priceomyces carsonii]